MKFRKALAVALATCMFAPNCVFADTVNVYIAGDSTACEYGEDEKYALPRGGWGVYLEEFLKGDVTVIDCARSGRSSKSLVVEEEYNKIFDNIKEGDYLLIQFGHNDAKNTKPEDIELRYTEPEGDKDTEGSFKNSLYVNYIKPAMDKGAKPILLTPISRRKFGEDGKVTDSHGKYDDAVRELAEELDIPCIDMTEKTSEIYNKFGEEDTKVFHAVFKDTSKGIDNTHLNRFGGKYIAALTAAEIMEEDKDGLGAFVNNSAITDVVSQSVVTRGEFTAKVVRMLGIEAEAGDNFADVKSDDANYAAIGTAKAAGIVKGNEKGEFMPDAVITKQDMYVITARALEYAKALEIRESGSSKGRFTNISNYAQAATDTLADCDMLDYYDVISSLVDVKTEVNSFEENTILVKAYEKKAEAEKATAEEISLEELEKVE